MPFHIQIFLRQQLLQLMLQSERRFSVKIRHQLRIIGLHPHQHLIRNHHHIIRSVVSVLGKRLRPNARAGQGTVACRIPDYQLFPDFLHFLLQPGLNLYQILLLPKLYPLVAQHLPQMVIIRKSHIRIVRIIVTVSVLIPQRSLDGCLIRRTVRIPVHGAPCLQMGQHPGIDRVPAIRIDMIGIIGRYCGLLLDHPFFFCKIICSLFAVDLHIKGKFPVQHRILVITEHQRKRCSQQGKRKQRRQCPHGKLHRPHLRSKLPQQKQILPSIDRCPAPAHITDDPGRQTQIEKINRDHQPHHKHRRLHCVSQSSEQLPEQQDKNNRKRKQNLFGSFELLFDLLIASSGAHKRLNIHLLKLPPAAKKRQQITAAVTTQRHKQCPAVRHDPQMILHPHHGAHHRHQNLLQ